MKPFTRTKAVKGPLPSKESLAQRERRELALRVAASSEFRTSARLHDFLLYICEKALSNSAGEIHEQQIGIAVFGKQPDYNCTVDNIVRVEARELRKRLGRYFASEGKNERLRIRIPKGTYVPVFEPNAQATKPEGNPELNRQAGLLLRVGGPAKGTKVVGSVSIIALLLAILFWITLEKLPPRRTETLAGGQSAMATSLNIWSRLFSTDRDTEIVVADYPLDLLEQETRKRVPLSDYADGRYLAHISNPWVRSIASAPLVSLADSIIVARIFDATSDLHSRTTVRYARDLRARDLEDDDLIFLGSSYSDPWITEFRAERNFRVHMDKTTQRLYYENRSPRPGELDKYYAYGKDGNSEVTYGLISFLPNLDDSGNVLILEGTTTEGTEAAGDFITTSHFSADLAHYLGLGRGQKRVPYFELLLKTSILSSAPTRIEPIAHRIIADPQ